MKTTFPRWPDDMLPPEKKDWEWHMTYCRAIYNDWMLHNGGLYSQARWKFNLIEDYMQGKQEINKYKPIVGVDERNDTTWTAIDWSVVPIIPKFKDMAISKIQKVIFDVNADPIDALAQSENEAWFTESKGRIRARQALQKIDPTLVDLSPLRPRQGEANDIEELDMQRAYTYKHQMGIEVEQGLEIILNQNDWDDIAKKLDEDQFKFGIAITKDWVDSNGAIKVRRVYPDQFVVGRSRRNDYKDAKYMGELKQMSIAELKQLAGSQFTEQDYARIAEKARGQFGNPDIIPESVPYGYGYDSFKVRVLDVEWESVDSVLYERGKDRRGNLRLSRASKVKESKSYKRTDYRVIYRASYILNTDYIFDWGRMTDMKRSKDRLMDTDFSYTAFAADKYDERVRSKGEEAITIADAIQVAWYQMQAAIARARPRGIAIELGAMEDVNMGQGGNKFTPMDIIDLYNQTGVLVYRREDANGTPSNYRPIEELQNGIGDEVARWFGVIQQKIQLLRDVWGLNEFTDGSTPDPRTLTTVAQMAYEATSNALYPIVEARRNIMKRLCSGLVLRLQDMVKRGPVQGYVRSMGNNSIQFFRMSERVALHDFGIRLTMRPTEEERQMFIQMATQLAGQDQLTMEDLVLIRNTDNMKVAEQLLAYRIKKRREAEEQKAKEMQLLNGQIQQQSAQSAEAAKQQTLQLEYQLKLQLEQVKGQWNIEVAKIRAEAVQRSSEISGESRVVQGAIAADSKEYQEELRQSQTNTTTNTEMQ